MHTYKKYMFTNEGTIHQLLKKLLWNMLKEIILKFFILIIVLTSCWHLFFIDDSIKLVLILLI